MNELLATARAAARAAAEVHRTHFGKVDGKSVRTKGNSDFVSFVDLRAQEAALGAIRSAFPDHRVLAEEEGENDLAAERADGSDPDLPLWIVDPLDGTTNFLHGHPAHCASVGVLVDGVPVAGAVSAHRTGEEWWAARGLGAWRNGERIRVSTVRALDRALVGTGFPFKRLDLLPAYLLQFERVLLTTSGIRREGSAALDLCYLAQGTFDLFWELALSPWDIAGGLAILTEAGGVATRVDGSPLDAATEGSVLGGNSAELMEALGRILTP